MRLITRVLTVPLVPPEKLRVRVIYSYITHKVFVKVSKRSVEGMGSELTSKCTIKNLLVSPKDKDPMVSQSDGIYWYQCGDLTCDDEYIGKPPGPLVKDTKSTSRTPHPLFITITKPTTPLTKTTSK